MGRFRYVFRGWICLVVFFCNCGNDNFGVMLMSLITVSLSLAEGNSMLQSHVIH